MRTDWIEHDGLNIPRTAPVIEVECRVRAPHDVLNWGWARPGEQHSPGDVLRYRLGPPFGGGSVRDDANHSHSDTPAVPNRAAILDTAREAVTKDRAATHGALESSFGQIAAIWSVRLGVTVTAAQVAIMMIDLKTVRGWGNPGHLDNWVDMAGYAACGGELAGGVA